MYFQKGLAFSIDIVEEVLKAQKPNAEAPRMIQEKIKFSLEPKIQQGQLRFIDLFAGIGGTRQAFEAAGAVCVFSSEWDSSAQKTYYANYGEMPEGDITNIRAEDIPDFDILVAGFPCQPFSIAGVSKKQSMGHPHGFLDRTQGTLFFDIARIIKEKKPKAFLLENVKNLKSHDGGKTFATITGVLEELGYKISHQIIDGRKLVPQHRERIYIAGFRDHTIDFKFPDISDKKPTLAKILEAKVDTKYTLSDKLWRYLQDYAKKQKEKGNGFGFSAFGPNDVARTLSARYYKDGSEILIKQKNKNPRRLTPRECARLMGFKDSFRIVVADTPAYKQFGNSVIIPVVKKVAQQIVKHLGGLKNSLPKTSKIFVSEISPASIGYEIH